VVRRLLRRVIPGTRTVPAVYNTEAHLGVAYPLYYGPLFFKIAGFFSSLWNPHGALRLVLALVFVLQFVYVRRALRRVGAAEVLASGVACVWVWST